MNDAVQQSSSGGQPTLASPVTPPFPTLCLPPAGNIGDTVALLDTPCLLLDADALERNLDRMQAHVAQAGLQLRPHAKAHKCPEIARAQLARGAVGICCQKLSEALPFILAGVGDIHISNELVGPRKAATLAAWARAATISVCVDAAEQVAQLAEATHQAGSRLSVLVELDIGHGRCGVPDADAVLRLVEALAAHPQLRFGGLQAYHGGLQHLRPLAQRCDAAGRAADRAAAVLVRLQAAGVRCPKVTGGGTGTWEHDLHSGVFTELQPGSYAVMDVDYACNEWPEGGAFEQALFVAASVMHGHRRDRLVLDAGLKSLSTDSGLPQVWREGAADPGLSYFEANDEHGLVVPDPLDQELPAPGSVLLLAPGHCDPTMNLHDQVLLMRQGRVEALWPVAARGFSR